MLATTPYLAMYFNLRLDLPKVKLKFKKKWLDVDIIVLSIDDTEYGNFIILNVM
jgi:hypothetical protein